LDLLVNTDEIPRKSTVLVIRANSTIGIAMVREFINHGDVVIATYCKSNPKFVHRDVKWVHLDLTDEKSIEIFTKGLAKSKLRIDSAIFVSGALPGKSLENYSYKKMNTVMDVNFLGQAKCVQALLPLLNSPSQILMISSVSGERGSYDPIYAASKGAVSAFVKSLATWLPPQVRCMSIAPGLVEGSGMYDAMPTEVRQVHLDKTPLNKLITVEDLAKIILDLTKDHWVHANGACIRINGGAYV
jgi:3-oxoacyl-[acyl-carrier protein] reductase